MDEDKPATEGELSTTMSNEKEESMSNEESKNQDESAKIRSTAVVKYPAAVKYPGFSKLQQHTDLKTAPANWLRKTSGLKPEFVFERNYFESGQSVIPKSFSMAYHHLSLIGDVDVISDATIIKKLLKMGISYNSNKAEISIAVHKIGKTLLFENFDIKKHIAEESEWSWFRDFYNDLRKQVPSKLLKKKPSSQYEKLMLSKFLYYSIKDSEGQSDAQNNNEDDFMPPSTSGISSKSQPTEETNSARSGDALPYPIPLPYIKQYETHGNSQEIVPSDFVDSEKRWQYWFPSDSKQPDFKFQSPGDFDRNILWTFEDLKMLLGTNMPIFGGGEYPAVSLVLQDSNKPINILTGIDYWLDNLICNVPELVMCFHVNGIVDNYQFIKTEDIPKRTNPVFKPQVIKDIAQNVLSFLKSNCTKEGHTYWLFKGSEDDVVKLYDLTTLMETSDTEKKENENPYTFSVALLLYTTAMNLIKDQEECRHKVAIKKLLAETVQLLEGSDNDKLILQCLCKLAEICLPDMDIVRSGIEDLLQTDTEPQKPCYTCETFNATKNSSEKNKNKQPSTELAISLLKDLSLPQKSDLQKENSKNIKLKGKSASELSDQSVVLKNDIFEGLNNIVTSCNLLSSMRKDEDNHEQLFDTELILAQSAAIAYYCLAFICHNRSQYGSALKFARLSLLTHEYIIKHNIGMTVAVASKTNKDSLPSSEHVILLKHRLLVLCGDIHLTLAKGEMLNKGSHISEYHEKTQVDQTIEKYFGVSNNGGHEIEKFTKILGENDLALNTCIDCYNTALDELNCFKLPIGSDTKRKYRKHHVHRKSDKAARYSSKIMEELSITVIRKLGYVQNELGSLYLGHAVNLVKREADGDGKSGIQHEKIWQKAFEHFNCAQEAFERVNDVINQSLVLSNKGRLMRVCARDSAKDSTGSLSEKERHFYGKAMDNYRQSLILLDSLVSRKPNDTNKPESPAASARDNVSWELSTTYFNMACNLQDGSTTSTDRHDVEKEITELLDKSLRHCQNTWVNTVRYSLAQYRQATIHYRIATLHHTAYRVEQEKNKRILSISHYRKAIDLYKSITGHPRDLLRVIIEKCSLYELFISEIKNTAKKSSVTIENLTNLIDCETVLEEIVSQIKSDSSSVDPVLQDGKEEEVGDLTGLLKIFSKMILNHQRDLIKLFSSNYHLNLPMRSQGQFKRRTIHENPESLKILKELYSRSLRRLHNLQSKDVNTTKSTKENQALEGNKETNDNMAVAGTIKDIIAVLQDLNAILFCEK